MSQISIVVFSLLWLLVEGTGIPLLSEVAFGPLGVAALQGTIHIWLAFVLAWGATSIGNTIGFVIFAHYGPSLIEAIERRWPNFARIRRKVEPFARRHLFLALTTTRFLGLGTFSVVLWMAGILGTPAKFFLPYLYALNLIWTALWLFGSKWLIQWVMTTLRPDTPGEVLALCGGAALVALFFHSVVPRLTQMISRNRGSAEES